MYIHSKLMIIDDTFLTLGSANINTRSMQVDSELNIAFAQPEVATKAREDLWQIHTNKETGNGESYTEAFDKWRGIIKENERREKNIERPIASLRGFMRLDTSLDDKD